MQACQHLRRWRRCFLVVPGLSLCSNPGLKLVNTFGVELRTVDWTATPSTFSVQFAGDVDRPDEVSLRVGVGEGCAEGSSAGFGGISAFENRGSISSRIAN